MREHCAAVNAFEWPPHESNFAASGSGTAGHCIKFINTMTDRVLNSIDAGSPFFSPLGNPHEKDSFSNYCVSKSEFFFWRCPSMCKFVELKDRTARISHMAASPSGSAVDRPTDRAGRQASPIGFFGRCSEIKRPLYPVSRAVLRKRRPARTNKRPKRDSNPNFLVRGKLKHNSATGRSCMCREILTI
jgi:hypothetical protein